MKYVLVSKIGTYIEEDFSKTKKNFSTLIEYCKYLFKQINKKYWDNKYQELNFSLLTPKIEKALDLDKKTLGCYWYKENTIYFRPEVWNLNDEQIIHLVKHELAHYFNHCDKVSVNHGKYFKRAMKQMGETGTKIANEDIQRDLSKEDTEEYNKFQEWLKKVKENMAKNRKVLKYEDCKPGMFASVLYEKTWQILTGFFTEKSTNKSKEFYVVSTKYLGKSKAGKAHINVTKDMYIVSTTKEDEKILKDCVTKSWMNVYYPSN